MITPNPTLYRRLHDEFNKLHADQGNIFGTVALEAAYTYGDDWLDQLRVYLKGNIDFVCNFLHERIPVGTVYPARRDLPDVARFPGVGHDA